MGRLSCGAVAARKEFVFGTAWPPQPQAPEPKDAREVGKQHLNLFPAATSSLIFRCRGESPGDVAGIFVQIRWNLAARSGSFRA
jgi:hypothetical protein